MLLPRGAITADQCFPLMQPIMRSLGSSMVIAGISSKSGSFHSAWASKKSISCFSSLLPAGNRLENTARYSQVAAKLLHEVKGPLEYLQLKPPA